MSQAARKPITDPEAFINALFAPLPEGVEPVRSRAFARECREAGQDRWNRAALLLWSCQLIRRTYFATMGRDPNGLRLLADLKALGISVEFTGAGEHGEGLVRACNVARERLMRAPAPTREALRRKRAEAKRAGMRPEWAALLDLDEARLDGRRP